MSRDNELHRIPPVVMPPQPPPPPLPLFPQRPVTAEHNPLRLASYIILILDLAFLIWGVVRLILIAFPKVQLATVEIVYVVMAFTREAYLDQIFEALQKLFLLPQLNRFNLPDVLLNTFGTIFIFVMGYVLYKLVNYTGKLLAKKLHE